MERIREYLREIRIGEHLREYLQDVRTLQAIAVGLLALALILGLIAFSCGVRYRQQEAALREALQEQPEQAPPPPEIQGGAFPAVPLPELTPSGRGLAAIPGLDLGDVMDNLDYGPGTEDFRCSGPRLQGEKGKYMWVCHSPPSGRPVYEVMVEGEDPLTVFSVEATAYSAPPEEAIAFLGYVGSLCFEESEPVNSSAWVAQNADTGGQLVVEDAELTLYGTEEVRTLTVVGTGISPEQTIPTELTTPDTTVPDGSIFEETVAGN